MKNKIIIDGFWGTGKTVAIKALEQKFNYMVINEPDHLKSSNLVKSVDINDWYTKQHEKNQNIFFTSGNNNTVMERSIISSIAYLHATKETVGTEIALKIFTEFKKKYLHNRVIFIFLYANKNELSSIANNIQNVDVGSKLKDDSFIAEYEKFYREILPSEHNIYPLFINIFNETGERKSTSEIINCIKIAH